MPLQIPVIDDRRYQALRDEALARRRIHTPEWTSAGESDPGVTLVELFAFLTENMLYQCNRVPEVNRAKFLQLLGVPLEPATCARGVVAIDNVRAPAEVVTLDPAVELRAGPVPFLTEGGLDVLPIEAGVFYKRRASASAEALEMYRLLYASYRGGEPAADLTLYETTALSPETGYIDLAQREHTVDGSIWVALMLRAADKPAGRTPEDWRALRERIASRIAGRTLSVGVVPAVDERTRTLAVAPIARPSSLTRLIFELPKLPAGGKLPDERTRRVASYSVIETRPMGNVLLEPGIVEVPLPADPTALALWTNLDPLEPGVGDFPPILDDPALAQRVITWLRVRPDAAGSARLLWVGINATTVRQCEQIFNEPLAPGDGTPDQQRTLARPPVVPESVRITVVDHGEPSDWKRIDDLFTAGPEVIVEDPGLSPGTVREPPARTEVFTVDGEAAKLSFGDGLRGKRLPFEAQVLASYESTMGSRGIVPAGAIASGAALPAGFAVTQPVRTWGGADAEDVVSGERQVPRYLQHRDRLVTVGDFRTIAWRTPGVAIGRIEVLPAFHPDLTTSQPGDAPGTVTLMVIPRFDEKRPAAPEPDRVFLDSICRYLDPRRLVTTEIVLRGPEYRSIWLSIGIVVKPGADTASVQQAVRERLTAFLSPLPPEAATTGGSELPRENGGWPLSKGVIDREILAEASRVDGVLLVNGVVLATETGGARQSVPIAGLQLPRLERISVLIGDPIDADALRGTTPAPVDPNADRPTVVPIPAIPTTC